MSKPRIAALSFTCAALFSVGFSISSAPIPVYAHRVAAQDTASHLKDGKKYLDKGLYTEALQKAEEALSMSPQSGPALLLKSEALLRIYAEQYFASTEEARAARRRQIRQTIEEMEKYSASNHKLKDADEWREQLEIMRGYVKHRGSKKAAEPETATKSEMTDVSGNEVFSSKNVVTKARVLSKPRPNYKGTNGVVVLRAILSAEGRVDGIVILRGVDPKTNHEAVKMARQIKFTPALKDGRPVSQYVQIEYNFMS